MHQVFVQNTGALANGTATDPSGVTAGKIAVFNAATGAEHSFEDAAAPTSFYFVQGHATQPRISPIIKAADVLDAVHLDYVAPARKLVSLTSIPSGPTGGDTYSVKVVNLKSGTEPFARKNYEVVVPASQLDEDTIYALVAVNKADTNRFVGFGGNKISTITVTGGGGTLKINITDGAVAASYSQAFDTSVAITIDNWLTSHAAAVLAKFGIVATDGTTTLILTGSVDTEGVGTGDFTTTDTGSATMAGSSAYTEATTLRIRSVDVDDNFQVFLNDTTGTGISAATQTVTTAFAVGSGSPDQVLALEQSAGGGYSNLYRESPQPQEVETFSDDAYTYDLAIFTIKTNQDGQMPVKGNQSYQIICASDHAVTGDFATFLP